MVDGLPKKLGELWRGLQYFERENLLGSALAVSLAYDIDDWFRKCNHQRVVRLARRVNRLRAELSVANCDFLMVYDPVTLPKGVRENLDVVLALRRI